MNNGTQEADLLFLGILVCSFAAFLFRFFSKNFSKLPPFDISLNFPSSSCFFISPIGLVRVDELEEFRFRDVMSFVHQEYEYEHCMCDRL